MRWFALILILTCFPATSVSAKDIVMKCFSQKGSAIFTFKLEKKWFSSPKVYLRRAGRWEEYSPSSLEKIENDAAWYNDQFGRIMIDFVDKRIVTGNGMWNCQ